MSAVFQTTEVRGKTYRVGRMPVMQQLHVSRRLSPLLAALAPAFGALAKAAGPAEQVAAVKPFADAFATLPDADAEYIVSTCLSVVSRDVEGKGRTWGPLYVQGVNCAEDLGLDTLLPLVVFVVKAALGPFIADFLTSAPAGGAEAPPA
jgi:hypothetical protein